jgi:Na+-driven multidrug efflux pump
MTPVSLREILRFYVPLVLTSQMMTLTGPIINVAVGRAADAKLDLAGYWLGFTILLFIESACLAVHPITATLVKGSRSLNRLLSSALAVGLAGSFVVLLVAVTPIGDPLFDHVIRTTGRAEALARQVLLVLAAVPTLVALRGVGTGLATRQKRTGPVAAATLMRVIVLSIVVAAFVARGTGSGALSGAFALLSGLAVETIFMLVVVARTWRQTRGDEARTPLRLTFGEIARVGTPIIVSAFVWTSMRPILNAVVGRLPDPELPQAGLGVVIPLVLATCSPIWTLQNVTLVLPSSKRDLAARSSHEGQADRGVSSLLAAPADSGLRGRVAGDGAPPGGERRPARDASLHGRGPVRWDRLRSEGPRADGRRAAVHR